MDKNKKCILWSELNKNEPEPEDEDGFNDLDGDQDDLFGPGTVKSYDFGKKQVPIYQPVNKFKLYEVNTNFYLDRSISDIIEFTEGIEILTVLTPYRCIVGVGHLFEPENTEKRVRDKIDRHFYPGSHNECSGCSKDKNSN